MRALLAVAVSLGVVVHTGAQPAPDPHALLAEGDRLDLQGQSFTQSSTADGSILLTLSGGGTIMLAGVTTFNAGFVV